MFSRSSRARKAKFKALAVLFSLQRLWERVLLTPSSCWIPVWLYSANLWSHLYVAAFPACLFLVRIFLLNLSSILIQHELFSTLYICKNPTSNRSHSEASGNRILGTHIQYTTEPLSHNESFVFVFPVFCYVTDNPGNGADLLWKA